MNIETITGLDIAYARMLFQPTSFSFMIKKIIAVAATALVSLSASAEYVRYDFGGPMGGYFIQHDDDGSIADFKIDLPIPGAPTNGFSTFTFRFFPTFSEGSTSITNATTYFRKNGPTNFRIYSDFGADQWTDFSVDFSRATQGNFAYTTTYSTAIYYSDMTRSFTGTHTGLVSEGTLSQSMIDNLDFLNGYGEQMKVIIPAFINPNRVPEPGSMALLAIGAIGAFSAIRRHKAVQ